MEEYREHVANARLANLKSKEQWMCLPILKMMTRTLFMSSPLTHTLASLVSESESPIWQVGLLIDTFQSNWNLFWTIWYYLKPIYYGYTYSNGGKVTRIFMSDVLLPKSAYFHFPSLMSTRERADVRVCKNASLYKCRWGADGVPYIALARANVSRWWIGHHYTISQLLSWYTGQTLNH